MTSGDCPDPDTCPVPDPRRLDLRRLRVVHVDRSDRWFSVVHRSYVAELFNSSGRGDTRFSPLVEDGVVVPALYAARTRTAALLETVFHDVGPTGVPFISRQLDLRNRALRKLQFIADVNVVDLRDDRLIELGLRREQLVATTAAHYCCTRDWALRIRKANRVPRIGGMLWRSRLTEVAAVRSRLFEDLTQVSFTDVLVLFGDRTDTVAISSFIEYGDLAAPTAARLIESVANELGAVIT